MPKPTRFPTSILYTPMDSIPLLSKPSVACHWGAASGVKPVRPSGILEVHDEGSTETLTRKPDDLQLSEGTYILLLRLFHLLGVFVEDVLSDEGGTAELLVGQGAHPNDVTARESINFTEPDIFTS